MPIKRADLYYMLKNNHFVRLHGWLDNTGADIDSYITAWPPGVKPQDPKWESETAGEVRGYRPNTGKLFAVQPEVYKEPYLEIEPVNYPSKAVWTKIMTVSNDCKTSGAVRFRSDTHEWIVAGAKKPKPFPSIKIINAGWEFFPAYLALSPGKYELPEPPQADLDLSAIPAVLMAKIKSASKNSKGTDNDN